MLARESHAARFLRRTETVEGKRVRLPVDHLVIDADGCHAGPVSQVAYRVPLEFITRVNGSYNDGGTTLTNSTCDCRIVENTQSYEVWNGGSIPSSRTNFALLV